ncbi:MAG: arsenate reductase ArsC [candidate division WOR-3 bacterium]
MTVLFVCTENACRSQMAEGWAKRLLPNWQAFSAGSRPRGSVDPSAILVMQEVGIDISGNTSKGFDALPLKKFDCVVTMGCGDACPLVPTRQRFNWEIPDPAGKGIEFYRTVRDTIRGRVSGLPRVLEELNSRPQTRSSLKK